MTTEPGRAVSAIAEEAGERLEQVRGELSDVDRRVREVVDQYPLASVLGAVVAGYLLARLTSRMS